MESRHCKRASRYLMSCTGVRGTRWGLQREGLVRTQKESDRVKVTHPLETADGRTCQDTERKPPSKEHGTTGGETGEDTERKKVE